MTAATSKQPTQIQLDTLDWMREYIAEHGMPPTIREIGAAFGIKSTNGVHDRLMGMKRKGLLRHAPGRARAWRPVELAPDLKRGVAP